MPNVLVASAPNVIVWLAKVIFADNPVGCDREYFAASTPVRDKLAVTLMAVPTLADANVPPPVAPTASLPTNPFKVETVMVAAVVPSYALLSAVAVTVRFFTSTVRDCVTFGAGL